MELHRILEKLEQVAPEQVRQWRRILPLVDDETRSRLVRQIVTVANQRLGDLDHRLLLSLPPQRVAAGELNLGTVVYDTEKWSFGLTKQELLQNIAIFGRSGAGKTNVAFIILRELIQTGVPFLFFDWKRTGRHLIPHLAAPVRLYTPGRSLAPLPFNPLIPPPGLETRQYVNMMIDILSAAFTLGDGAKSVLQQAIMACYAQQAQPSISDVRSRVEQIDAKNREKGWQISALRALRAVELLCPAAAEPTSQANLVSSLLRSNTILELDGLNESEKKFLVPLLSVWVFYEKMAAVAREELQLVLLIEEAHHVFYGQQRGRESVMNQLLRQCRELGLAMVIVDQHPHLISSAVQGNTYTSICLNLKEPSDINRAAALSLLDDHDKEWLSMLPTGHGIVKLQDRWPKPFLVKFPHVSLSKGLVTDDQLQALLGSESTRSPVQRALPPKNHTLARPLNLDNRFPDAAIALVGDVVSYPDDGVNARYQRLALSTDHGNRLKQHLVRSGILEQELIKVGRSRKVILRVSPQARQELGTGGSMQRESLVHVFWKRHYAALLAAHGFHVTVEAPRISGRADVLGIKDERRLAIEIETGKSDILENVRQDLLSGFERIVIVATDEKALLKVERELARAGLVIPQRISVVLRDQVAGVLDLA